MTESGLEGVVVAETELSDVDGERGRLVIRGHDVEDLVRHTSYEGVLGLLWGLDAPGADAIDVGARLGAARRVAFDRLGVWASALEAPDGMEALRRAIGQLGTGTTGRALDDDLALVGAVAVMAAAWSRARAGLSPVAPCAEHGHAADYLRMMTGHEPSDAAARALDRYFVAVIDHGMNASTFAARVVASTGASTISAVVAAIGALSGPLHGGAPGPVLDMLDAIGAPERARAWLLGELAAGRRIMGMGHRVYRVRDPRAAVLEEAAKELERAGIGRDRLRLAAAVEQEAERVLAERAERRATTESTTRSHREPKRLHANVELYTAVLLDAVGVPRASFSSTFAVSRVAGWCAHVAEQRARGRLIRPSSRYVGPAVGLVERAHR